MAAELFGGWEDPRTILFRMWLHLKFTDHWYGRLLLEVYSRFGERAAEWLRHDFFARAIFRNLFNRGLAQAEEWLATRPGRMAVERHNWMVGTGSRFYLSADSLSNLSNANPTREDRNGSR